MSTCLSCSKPEPHKDLDAARTLAVKLSTERQECIAIYREGDGSLVCIDAFEGASLGLAGRFIDVISFVK
jgi:hypothetical protein